MSEHAHKHDSNRQHSGLRPGGLQDHDRHEQEHDHEEEIRLRPEKAKQGRARPNMLIVLGSSLTLAALAGLGIFLIYW